MEIIKLDQGSEEWIDWRKTKITASEMPIILGKSKYDTPYTLWQKKLGFVSEEKDNYAMKRGRDLEPVVRDIINLELSKEFIPAVVIHDELKWASASLDGLCDDQIIEIKCPNLENHQCAQSGNVPETYYDQIQWQLFVTGLDSCLYISYYKMNDMAKVEVKRDDEYIKDVLLPAAQEFYYYVIEMKEPPKNEKDIVQIVDDEFEVYAREWKAANEMASMYSEKEKYYKEKLISFTDDGDCTGYGVTLKRINREGSVKWNKLMEDLAKEFPEVAAKYNPESYRSNQIGYWKISKEN